MVLLKQGAMAYGYRTELWTTQRISVLIERRFGVKYHRNHIGKLLHQLGWSHQKPERRAIERNEAAIVQWKRTVWPAVKKTPRGWQPTSSNGESISIVHVSVDWIGKSKDISFMQRFKSIDRIRTIAYPMEYADDRPCLTKRRSGH